MNLHAAEDRTAHGARTTGLLSERRAEVGTSAGSQRWTRYDAATTNDFDMNKLMIRRGCAHHLR